MNTSQPSNAELVRLLEPWFHLFSRVAIASERDFLAAIPFLGIPRKTERASDFHRAFRTNFRRVCDRAEPLLVLQEEPEGKGLDYLRCQMNPDIPFALRWARFNGESVRRNRTERSTFIQQQGFFPKMESDSDLPTVTLAHTVEDEFTEAGRSCLWIGKLLLLREREDESEVITEVHVFQKPNRSGDNNDVPAPLITARQSEDEEWGQIIQRIKRVA